MSDRIAVVQHGTVTRVVDAGKLTHDDLVRASAGAVQPETEEILA